MLEDSLELSYKIYKLKHVLSQSPDLILYIHPRGLKIGIWTKKMLTADLFTIAQIINNQYVC